MKARLVYLSFFFFFSLVKSIWGHCEYRRVCTVTPESGAENVGVLSWTSILMHGAVDEV